MPDIPISFTHEGKTYSGTLEEVSGAGATVGNFWHLMIDKYYYGQLLFTNGKFVFWPQNEMWLKDFEGYMGEVVTLWYG